MARRPLLLRESDGVEEVLWGGQRHLYSASRYLANLVVSGRIEAHSTEMRRLKGMIRHRQGEMFNDDVIDLLRENSDLVVWPRVSIKDGKLNLGDVDALVANPQRHVLYAIECKAFVAGRMPHELYSELRKLLVSENGYRSPIDP